MNLKILSQNIKDVFYEILNEESLSDKFEQSLDTIQIIYKDKPNLYNIFFIEHDFNGESIWFEFSLSYFDITNKDILKKAIKDIVIKFIENQTYNDNLDDCVFYIKKFINENVDINTLQNEFKLTVRHRPFDFDYEVSFG